MQNLVGVRIADATEQAWIGQRTLQRVVLPLQCGMEIGRRETRDLHAAGIVLLESRATARDIQRRALPRSRFRQQQRPVREIECQRRLLRQRLRGRVAPVQAPGDHQMENQPQIAIEADRDALADALQRA